TRCSCQVSRSFCLSASSIGSRRSTPRISAPSAGPSCRTVNPAGLLRREVAVFSMNFLRRSFPAVVVRWDAFILSSRDDSNMNGACCRKQVSCPGYVAHELSGFIASPEGLDEPDDMATGPQDAEVSGCFEPLGAQGAIGDGGWRAFGMLGAAVPAVPPALRGGWACRAGRSPARQGVAA